MTAGVDLSLAAAYDYELPEELVARYPAERRDESRLLVVPMEGGAAPAGSAPDPARVARFEHRRFTDIVDYLRAGDLLVLNESRVLPARLLGVKPTGARCEVLLVRPVADAGRGSSGAGAGAGGADAATTDGDPLRWEALVRPGSKLGPGRRVIVAPGELEIEIEDVRPNGDRVVRLETPLGLRAALERYGRIPLPPYLERDEEPIDRERYQTVFARVPGSVAAPTAGLHFTPELLADIAASGIEIARVILHVGPGTFRPVDVERIHDHEMHAEWWEIPKETAELIARTRARGGCVWAVGTTVVRTLESAAVAPRAVDAAANRAAEGAPTPHAARRAESPRAIVAAGSGETRLFLHPGVSLRVVDGLVTNFHLPRSTLLMLVAAAAGYERTMAAYAEAVRERYRFHSYGDAMLIVPAPSSPAPRDHTDTDAAADRAPLTAPTESR